MAGANNWESEKGYIFAMIGSAVGFANILGFSAKCYAEGGGAYLIPLLVALLSLGIPMLILEGVIGKTLKLPLVSAYKKVLGNYGPLFAWPTIIGVMTISGYYCVICSWTIAYTYFSATLSIPQDTSSFFFNDFLHSTTSILSYGDISLFVLTISAIVCLFTYWVNIQEISKGIEKICSVFLPTLSVLLLILLFFVIFLPGSEIGFKKFLIPDFSVLRSPQVWLSAYGHVFFSLSVGLSLIVGYSRYTDKSVNISSSMIMVAIGDTLTSIVSGAVIFGGIGYMAAITNQPFEEVVNSSTFGLGFIVIPTVLQTFHPVISQLSGVIFFFCLLIAGITGLISIIDAISGNISSEFGISQKRSVAISTLICFFFAFIFSWGNSSELISTLDGITTGVNVLLSGLFQIIIFLHLSKEIANSEEWKTPHKRKTMGYYSLKYFSPFMILFILYLKISEEISDTVSSHSTIKWVWLATTAAISIIITCMPTSANKKLRT